MPVDKDTLYYLLYYLYVSNVISRNVLQQIFQKMMEPPPENMVKFFADELKKLQGVRHGPART